ncbi:MAG: cysteine--tRNA ligase [Deltaproteobacteria bacterium]|nr:cysteine--tRNA ligase [Deltaproteobacteria bacterium]
MKRSLLDTIGNTPIVEIKKLNPNPKVKIFAKLEYMNPGGSVKDRIAYSMILDGENKKTLTSDKIIIEATSGNTGIGLALICAIKGYKLMIAMSETASEERKQILKAMGAQLILTPAALGTDGAIEEVYNIARENPNLYFMTDQFNNPANWQAHYYGTANEIWEQTNREITALIATMGTTGTVMGLSRRLKELNNKIKIIGVEPYLGHKLQGLKNMKEAYCPELYQKELLDKKINIDDDEAFEMTRRLAKEEGLFVGMSSGGALSIARKEAAKMESGVIAVIFPDGGERYLSTPLFAPKAKTNIRFFNTISGKKENFSSLKANEISVYSSGPAAFSKIDLSECRRYLLADIICRYFKFLDFGVKQITDITDMDDKTIEASLKKDMSITEFTQKNIKSFKRDLKTLNIQPASDYPKASEHIQDMIRLAKKLVEKGFAYEKLRSLYFDISKCKEYGKLSRMNLDKIKIGATVDLDSYEKNNPKDFTLFKRAKLSELKRGIYAKTDWGNVRPCWHIQSAAIAAKYLGETFDIHISARDLIFPHHENKIAIAESATGKPLAKYWIDCDKVMFNGKKIDKESNFYTVEDLLKKGYTGEEIRYWLIATHYGKPITLSDQRLNYRKRALLRINRFILTLINIKQGNAYSETEQLCYDIKNDFTSAMDDDLNVSAALASIFINIKKINGLIADKKLNKVDAQKIIKVFKKINTVLQIFDFDKKDYDKNIETLIKKRERARENKDWAKADKIREELKNIGVDVCDRKMGG